MTIDLDNKQLARGRGHWSLDFFMENFDKYRLGNKLLQAV